jgi:lactate dehydrogenase-like 2-hydroxyacid dehydrogenase
MMRILFADARSGLELDVERRVAGPDFEFDVQHAAATAEVPEESWRRADAIIVNNKVHLTQEVAAKAERCRIVVRAGVGYDKIDGPAWAARGIPVCNTPDYGTTEVADTAIAMMLSFARGIDAYQPALHADLAGNWRFAIAPAVRRLRGAVFGVVGMGRIGMAAARRAAAFDMDIAFFDPYLPNGTELALGYRRLRSLEELLGLADVVSIHAPLTDGTRGLIGADAIARMKPGAMLINTARGPILDLAAVHDGLKSGRLGAVGLDVTPVEPPSPDEPLIRAWRSDEDWIRGRFLLTPHAAFYSGPALEDMRVKSTETAVRFLREGVLNNCVNGVSPK